MRNPEQQPFHEPPGEKPKQTDEPAMEYGELSPEEREQYELLEEQYNNPHFVEIEAPELPGEKLRIEYIMLDARTDADRAEAEQRHDRTVVHIPGFGSSYRSPKNFTQLLALREKKRVIVMSQPSTGGSDMAPKAWRTVPSDQRSFAPFAEVTSRAINAIRQQEAQTGVALTTEELSVVSSSMGSIIATELAAAHPEQVSDLVLLHPGGVNEEPTIDWRLIFTDKTLASRYFPETVGSKRETMGRKSLSPKIEAQLKDTLAQSLHQQIAALETSQREPNADTERIRAGIEYLQTQLQQLEQTSLADVEQQETDMYKSVTKRIAKDSNKNLWRGKAFVEGLQWRLWEAFTIAKGGLLNSLPKVKANTYVVFGTADKLFPAEQMEKVKPRLPQGVHIRTDITNMRHDEIYQRPRDYTARVGSFLDAMREEELKQAASE